MYKIALRNGLLMTVCFAVYFLLMQLFSVGAHIQYRLFNGVIQLVFLTLAIKAWRKQFPEKWNYLSGGAVGFITTIIGVLPFTIFATIYLAVQPELFAEIKAQAVYIGDYLTPFTSGLIITMEGIGFGFMASYIIMRIVDHVEKPKESSYRAV